MVFPKSCLQKAGAHAHGNGLKAINTKILRYIFLIYFEGDIHNSILQADREYKKDKQYGNRSPQLSRIKVQF